MKSQMIQNIFTPQNSTEQKFRYRQKINKANEFKKIFNDYGIKLSKHAAKRVGQRKVEVNSQEFMKIREGINKLKEKGGKDSLVVTAHGAYIIDVGNDTVVTAMGKRDIVDNIFTKIDSTVFIN